MSEGSDGAESNEEVEVVCCGKGVAVSKDTCIWRVSLYEGIKINLSCTSISFR
jgi:hypothetical protein